MKKIIVPTDFSEVAWNAFLFAAELADKLDTSILIINTYREPPSGADAFLSLKDIMKRDSESGLSKLSQRIREAGLAGALNIEYISSHGSLVDVLKSQIKYYDDQLIVMGSLGETGFLEKLIGSNASAVVNKVNCPIFVIPPGAEFSLDGKIVFAADFDKVPREINLNILKKLFSLHASTKVELVHVTAGNAISPEQIPFIKALGEVPFEPHVISSFDVVEALDKYATESKVDLLVLVKKKKGIWEKMFQESVTRRLTLLMKTPLLILKSEK